MAQVHDLWRSPEGSGVLTPEERWGWRFAVVWRLAIACLMVGYFVVLLLVAWKFLVFHDGGNLSILGCSGVMLEAVLLISTIVAIASSPRLRAGGADGRGPSDCSPGLPRACSCADLLRDQLLIAALVHITIAGIQAAWPLAWAPDYLATYGPAHVAWFLRITTLGVVSVLASGGLLSLIAVRWRQGWTQRVSLGVLLAASLATMALLAGRIALVEVPALRPSWQPISRCRRRAG